MGSYTCKEAIIGQIAAQGPQEARELRIECKTQATDYSPEAFVAALKELKTEGTIEFDAYDNVYDLSETYYEGIMHPKG